MKHKDIKTFGFVYVTAPFPKDLEKKARIQAATMGISRSALVRLAVEAYLKNYSNAELAGDVNGVKDGL